MAVLVCPRCQRTNPAAAAFCYFDGALLQPGKDGAAVAPLTRLAQEFVFPSGRRCRSFDELAQGCQDEWASARDLLAQGIFRQFFIATGRADLAKAAQEAMAQENADIGLTRFLGSLPVSELQAPKLDLSPRRVLLGRMLAGETNELTLTITNQGKGILQGTLSVSEGNDWLHLQDGTHQCAVNTPREQKIHLVVQTKGVAAGQTYGAKITVVTNGGVVEVPFRLDLVAHPFTKPPFQGVRTPREMAEKMRRTPKPGGPLLESGEIARWFHSNSWAYPVRGAQARGVAAVQQYFEAMGLSKPPPVQLSQSDVRFTCKYPDSVRLQVAIQTAAKKWVYAQVSSDSHWLKVLTPLVSGPQQATIGIEVDPRSLAGARGEGKLQIVANAGQTLSVRIAVEVQGAPGFFRLGASPLLGSAAALAMLFLLVRLALVPVVDMFARGTAVRSALARQGSPPPADSPLSAAGGWLQLPWPRILLGTQATFPADLGISGQVSVADFRHYFASYFIRAFVLCTWWVGAAVGFWILWKRGGWPDAPWGFVAGGVAGVAGAATLGCVFLVVEIIPHLAWSLLLAGKSGTLAWWLAWVVFAVASWTIVGAILGLVLSLLPPLRRTFAGPVQNLLGGIFRMCGLRGLAALCGSS